MKRLILFITFLAFSVSLVTPLNNVHAQNSENMNEVNLTDLLVDDSLLNGTESFSIIKDVNEKISVQKDDLVITPLATSIWNVTINEEFGGITGKWAYTNAPSDITGVNIKMNLNYRTSWLDFTWETLRTETFNYNGGLGRSEYNEKTWFPRLDGQYRVCASGTIYRKGGEYTSVTGCSGTISHDGSIIIAREVETSNEVESNND